MSIYIVNVEDKAIVSIDPHVYSSKYVHVYHAHAHVHTYKITSCVWKFTHYAHIMPDDFVYLLRC